MYYLRTEAAVDAIKFTVEKQAEMPLEPIISSDTVKVTQEQLAAKNISDMACSLDNPEGCEACGS
jgi:ribonucleoside-diphosphate reductase alpha chain